MVPMTGRPALSPDELLTTTRTVRKRLDFARPVPREVIETCIELAIQAPNGHNSQGWQWVVVDDEQTKQVIAEIYREQFPKSQTDAEEEVALIWRDRADPATDERLARASRFQQSAFYLRKHLHEAPFFVIPCQWGRLPAASSTFTAVNYWASILPAVWSFQLALRSRGLGAAFTTLHLKDEERVADLLGIPYRECTQVALLPVAYTIGTDFRPAPRAPAHESIHWNRWSA